jgi:hypothetical protein
MVVATPSVTKNLSNAVDAHRHDSDTGRLRARARRYRRLAELLFDEKIIAIVLASAHEFDERADALAGEQNTYAGASDWAELI